MPNQFNLTPAAPVVSKAVSSGEVIRGTRQPRHYPSPWLWVAVAAGVISLCRTIGSLWKRFHRDRHSNARSIVALLRKRGTKLEVAFAREDESAFQAIIHMASS